jgi:hypothetical protein
MNNNQRITLEDNLFSALAKLAEGNPGALTAMMKMSQESPAIDPDAAFGPFAPLFSLDTMGLYGSHIWNLWKVCQHSTLNISILFRQVQMGLMSESKVTAAAHSGKAEFDFPALLAQLQELIPAFGRDVAAAGAPA